MISSVALSLHNFSKIEPMCRNQTHMASKTPVADDSVSKMLHDV